MNDEKRDLQWWRKKGPPHEQVFANVDRMLDDQRQRSEDLEVLRHVLLDRDSSDAGGVAQRVGAALRTRKRRAAHNVTANAVETVHAQITANKTSPWVVTSGASWETFQRGRLLTKFLEGEFHRLDVAELASDACEDALAFGDGFVKGYVDDNDLPALEIVWPGEVMVDQRERKYGPPRTMYQRKPVDKEWLASMYPKHRSAIDEAMSYEEIDGDIALDDGLTDHVLVVESWHLPVRGKGGRHVICIDKATLLDEEWDEEDFPIERLRFRRDPRDYYGVGMIEGSIGLQAEVNMMTDKISHSFELMAPKVAVSRGSKVNVGKLDNLPWSIVEFSGPVPPQFMTPPAINPDQIRYKDDQIRSYYESNGISMSSAMSQMPAGLTSGRAQLVHRDTFSQRYIRFTRAWEKFHMSIAKLLVRLAKRIAKDDEKRKSFKTHVGKEMMQEIRWQDAYKDGEFYDIRVYPISALATSPEGRLSQVQQMAELGVLTDSEEIADLLDYPDLEQHSNMRRAWRDLIKMQVDKCLEGKQQVADPSMPLEWGHKYATQMLASAKIHGAPDSVLDKLRNYISHIQKHQATLAASQAAAAQPMSPDGMVAPMPVPAPDAGVATTEPVVALENRSQQL